jgi:hypothetical protein
VTAFMRSSPLGCREPWRWTCWFSHSCTGGAGEVPGGRGSDGGHARVKRVGSCVTVYLPCLGVSGAWMHAGTWVWCQRTYKGNANCITATQCCRQMPVVRECTTTPWQHGITPCTQAGQQIAGQLRLQLRQPGRPHLEGLEVAGCHLLLQVWQLTCCVLVQLAGIHGPQGVGGEVAKQAG